MRSRRPITAPRLAKKRINWLMPLSSPSLALTRDRSQMLTWCSPAQNIPPFYQFAFRHFCRSLHYAIKRSRQLRNLSGQPLKGPISQIRMHVLVPVWIHSPINSGPTSIGTLKGGTYRHTRLRRQKAKNVLHSIISYLVDRYICFC